MVAPQLWLPWHNNFRGLRAPANPNQGWLTGCWNQAWASSWDPCLVGRSTMQPPLWRPFCLGGWSPFASLLHQVPPKWFRNCPEVSKTAFTQAPDGAGGGPSNRGGSVSVQLQKGQEPPPALCLGIRSYSVNWSPHSGQVGGGISISNVLWVLQMSLTDCWPIMAKNQLSWEGKEN